MPALYIDNFRGFSSTFLELRGVNFFVGENSTGKTSILKILGAISSPGFWHYQQFDNSYVNFGTFSEMISLSRTNKEYFELGLLGDERDGYVSAVRLKFIEKDNFPQLKEICFVDTSVNLQVYIEGKSILKYRYRTHIGAAITENAFGYFQSWIKDVELDDLPFKKEETYFIGIISILFHFQSLIGKEIMYNHPGAKKEDLKLLVPFYFKNIAWFSPMRSEPKKTYDEYLSSFIPDGRHIPYILNDILKNDTDNFAKRILNRFGLDSGLYDDLSTRQVGSDNLGNTPFEILIKKEGAIVNLINMGFGVSQVLPLIVEAIARPTDMWFSIQQPEIHLHPRAQSAFGEFIYKAHELDGHNFIIETHSDYLIDRFRLRINRAHRENKSTIHPICQVFFFSKSERENSVVPIDVLKDGSYSDEQPESFRKFFIKEQIDLLSI